MVSDRAADPDGSVGRPAPTGARPRTAEPCSQVLIRRPPAISSTTVFGRIRIRLRLSRASLPAVAFVLILAAAAFFRLDLLNLAEFKGDEAGTSFIVRSLVQQGRVPFLGPPLTTGGHDGPFYYYLLAIPFAVSTDPVVASAFVAVLNLIGIVVTFMFAKEFFGRRVALLAVAFDAMSPFSILFSRKIWNPDVVFPFAIVALYCLYSFVVRKKSAYIIPLFVTYALLVQIHSVALLLGPVVLFFLVKFRSQTKPAHLLAAVLLSLLVLSPMLYGLASGGAGEGGAAVTVLRSFGALDPRSIADVSAITGGTGFGYILGSSAGQFFPMVFDVNQLLPAESVCLLIGMFYVLYRSRRDPFGEGVKYSLLFAWVAVPTLVLLLFNPPFLLPHEVTMLLPANFLVVAVFFDALLSKKRWRAFGRVSVPARALAVAVLLLIIVSQAVFAVGFLAFVGAHGGTGGDYGVGLQYKQEAAQYMAQTSNGKGFTISSDLTPGDIGVEYTYLLSTYGRAPSKTASLNYVVVDGLSHVDPSLVQSLSNDTKADFGPLTVYSYTT